jgi:beta-lactamase inhibitory protein II
MKKLVSILSILVILFSLGSCSIEGKTVSISASNYLAFALKSNGTVVPYGLDEDDTSTKDWKDVKKVVVGFNDLTYEVSVAAALTNDGKVLVNYYDFSDISGVVKNTYSAIKSGYYEKILECENVVDITTDGKFVYALKDNGEIVFDGISYLNEYYSLPEFNFSAFKDVKSISASTTFVVGLKNDGTAVSIGGTTLGANVSDFKDITAITTKDNYTIGIKTDGTVVATKCIINDDEPDYIKLEKLNSYNKYGELDFEDWTDIKEIASGGSHTVGLKSDGTVVAVGNNNSGQCDVGDWTDIVDIEACSGFTLGLKADGTIVATRDTPFSFEKN